MTETEYAARFDFLCEKRLQKTDAKLHKRYRIKKIVFEKET